MTEIDLAALVAKAQTQAEEAEDLADSLEESAAARGGEGEMLIQEVAKQLATIRRASDLPEKDASQFAQAIRERQRKGA